MLICSAEFVIKDTWKYNELNYEDKVLFGSLQHLLIFHVQGKCATDYLGEPLSLPHLLAQI